MPRTSQTKTVIADEITKKRPATETPGRGKEKVIRNDGNTDDDISLPSPRPIPTDSHVLTVDTMKELLRPLHEDVASIKSEISALRALQTEVHELSIRVGEVETRMENLVQTKISELVPDSLVRDVESLKRQRDEDTRRKQAMVFNLPPTVARDNLRKYMDTISHGISAIKTFVDKKGKGVASVRFPDMESRNRYVDAFRKSERTYQHNSQSFTLKIQKDLPEHVRERDRVLKAKFKEVQDSAGTGAPVSLDWQNRSIRVHGSVLFTQDKSTNRIVKIQ